MDQDTEKMFAALLGADTVNVCDTPYDPGVEIPDEALVAKAAVHRQSVVCAGMAFMPMLRQTTDNNRRVGFAYEGEELLVYLKQKTEGWVVKAHRKLPEIGGEVLTRPIPTYETALTVAYEFARRMPSGVCVPDH